MFHFICTFCIQYKNIPSNLHILREFIWEWVMCMHYYFWNPLACSLAKCVEVRLFDNENKGNNLFNMTLKTVITFEFPLQRINLFLTLDFPNHGHLYLCECAGVTLVPNKKRDNSLWLLNSLCRGPIRMTCKLSIRPYFLCKARKETGSSSPMSVDRRSRC